MTLETLLHKVGRIIMYLGGVLFGLACFLIPVNLILSQDTSFALNLRLYSMILLWSGIAVFLFTRSSKEEYE